MLSTHTSIVAGKGSTDSVARAVLPATARPPALDVSPLVPDWLNDAVFYQIFPERFANADPMNDPVGTLPWGGTPTRDNFFGGDLQGVREHLDHIQGLGANTLYLTPIFTASTNHRYDGEDYFSVDPALGGDDALDALIADLHARGMRLVLDGVFNHCGWHHPYFEDVVRHEDKSPYVNWFYTEDFPVVAKPRPNYGTCSGCEYLPKWNVYNPEVRKHHLDVALYWLDRGIDGWRLDVPYFINDNFWRIFRRTVKEKYPDACLIGEEWEAPTRWLHGDMFDGTMNYGVRNFALDFCARMSVGAAGTAAAALELQDQIPPQATAAMMNLVGSHDTPRLLQECHGNVAHAIAALALMFTFPGAPMIYYGDEVGLMGENDPGCRACMPWESSLWNGELLESVRQLGAVRGSVRAFGRGHLEVAYAKGHVVALRNRGERSSSVTLVNRDLSATLIPVSAVAPQHRVAFAVVNAQPATSPLVATGDWLEVPGQSVIVVEEES